MSVCWRLLVPPASRMLIRDRTHAFDFLAYVKHLYFYRIRSRRRRLMISHSLMDGADEVRCIVIGESEAEFALCVSFRAA